MRILYLYNMSRKDLQKGNGKEGSEEEMVDLKMTKKEYERLMGLLDQLEKQLEEYS